MEKTRINTAKSAEEKQFDAQEATAPEVANAPAPEVVASEGQAVDVPKKKPTAKKGKGAPAPEVANVPAPEVGASDVQAVDVPAPVEVSSDAPSDALAVEVTATVAAAKVKDDKQERLPKKDYESIEEIAKKYVRIGTEIYRIFYETDGKKRLKPWAKPAIKDDYGSSRAQLILDNIKKAVSDGYYPDHLNHKQFIQSGEDLIYNRYEPIPYKPKEGGCENIMTYLRHIFGFEHDQLEEGLDYLTLMFLRPKQKLPILALVSKERETAKTTFLNFVNAVFGANAHFMRAMDLGSNFNGDLIGKLVLLLDEANLRDKAIVEIIKSMVTALTQPIEAKGKERINAETFLKIILASNFYDGFAFIDNEETRYWVRYIPPIKERYAGDYLNDKLVPEIPAFLHFLQNRPMKHKESQSRMWFPYEAIYTKWLGEVKANSVSVFEKELVEYLKEMFEGLPYTDTLSFRLRPLIDLVKDRSSKRDLSEHYFKRIIKERFGAAPEKKASRFMEYTDSDMPDTLANGELSPYKGTEYIGKALVFTREMLGLERLEQSNFGVSESAVLEDLGEPKF